MHSCMQTLCPEYDENKYLCVVEELCEGPNLNDYLQKYPDLETEEMEKLIKNLIINMKIGVGDNKCWRKVEMDDIILHLGSIKFSFTNSIILQFISDFTDTKTNNFPTKCCWKGISKDNKIKHDCILWIKEDQLVSKLPTYIQSNKSIWSLKAIIHEIYLKNNKYN